MPIAVKDTFPLTHEQAVQIFKDAPIDAQESRMIEKHSVGILHHGIGMVIRNVWHLWEPTSPLRRHYQERFQLGHADDMSGLILAEYVAWLRGQKFDLEAEAEAKRKYWRVRGVDPLTQEKMKAED